MKVTLDDYYDALSAAIAYLEDELFIDLLPQSNEGKFQDELDWVVEISELNGAAAECYSFETEERAKAFIDCALERVHR